MKAEKNNLKEGNFSVKKVKVEIINAQKNVKIPSGMRILIRRCCNATLSMEEFPYDAEVSIRFSNNSQIQELNCKHRNIDKPTDVLSFPMGENGEYDTNPETGAKILGDIVISVEKAEEQSKAYGHSFQREMSYLTAHAMLHLLGYDHEEIAEKNIMREKEEAVMCKIGTAFTNKKYAMAR